MTNKQVRFCQEYLVDLNGKRAAIRAGYSEKSASASGRYNLRQADVRQVIAQKMEQLGQDAEGGARQVIKELQRIAFCDPAVLLKQDAEGLPVLDDLAGRDGALAAVAQLKQGKTGIDVKFYDKLKALELLGRHFGMFSERENGEDEGKVEILDDVRAPS